ncbi:MAG: hypothetical protein HYX73_02360 [Acidobacteria bacterium]|nr:hypothetical protein [Acidobacteriota bacterium]
MWNWKQMLISVLLGLMTWRSTEIIARTAPGSVHKTGQEDHGHTHNDELPDREIKINEQGEINLPSPMKLRDVLLQKGRYRVRHRFDAGEHWFSFVAVARDKDDSDSLQPIEAEATAIRTRDQVRNSVILAISDGHDYRIVKVQLAGENTEYLF